MMNRKQTKRALLSSVVALLLCFTMLLGATFAWFTDTAQTKVSGIQAGKLDITLVDANGTSLEGQTLSWQKASGHENEDVLWEPGATYSLQPVTIKNNGNLALKYKVVLSGINGDAKLNEVIDWTVNGVTVNDDRSLAVDASETLTISGTMKTSAGNAYQGLSIESVAITVYATQDTVEYDSTTNEYDKDATYATPVSNETELIAALNNGSDIVLTSDIQLNSYLNVSTAGTVNLDLNNHQIVRSSGDTGIYVNNSATTLNITGSGAVSASNEGIWVNAGTVNIYGGTYTSLQAVYVMNTGIANIYGGTFRSENTEYGANYILNQKDDSRTTSQINVCGGTFINFNPANNAAEGAGTNFVASGYTVKTSTEGTDTVYTVVAE